MKRHHNQDNLQLQSFGEHGSRQASMALYVAWSESSNLTHKEEEGERRGGRGEGGEGGWERRGQGRGRGRGEGEITGNSMVF